MANYPETISVRTANLSLFGWPEDISDRAALALILQISSAYNFRPEFGLLGERGSNKIRAMKLANAIKAVNAESASGQDYICIYEAFQKTKRPDWRWVSSIEYHARGGRKRFAVRLIPQSKLNYDTYFNEAVLSFLQSCNPVYGYCATLPLNWNPSMYDDGVLYGQSDEVDRSRIVAWRNECFWRIGGDRYDVMRDIFPVNFLNFNQIKKVIDSRPLDQWIALHQLGQVTKISSNLWKWTLTPAQALVARPVLLDGKHLAVTK